MWIMSNVFGNFGTLFYFVHFWETVAKQVKSRISGWEVDPIRSFHFDPFRLRIPHWSPHLSPTTSPFLSPTTGVPSSRATPWCWASPCVYPALPVPIPTPSTPSKPSKPLRQRKLEVGTLRRSERTLEDVNSCNAHDLLNSSVNFFWNLPSSKCWSSFVLETNSFLGSAGDGTLFLPETSTAGVRSCCRASGVPWRRHVLRRFLACWFNDSTYKRYETLSNDIINNIIYKCKRKLKVS